MNKRFGLMTLAWTLLGLLVIAASLFVLGTRERRAAPSAFSYGPSGTAAFVQLLRNAGYRVEITRRSKPALTPETLAIGFLIKEVDAWNPEAHAEDESARKHFRESLARGARALLVQIPADFSQATRTAAQGTMSARFDASLVSDDGQTHFEITRGGVSFASPNDPFPDEAAPPYVAVLETEGDPLLEIQAIDKGLLATVLDGTGATNRFLDRAQNADFLLWAVGMINPDRRPILILESMSGEAVDPGLLGTLGSWATAAWWQFVLVLVVVAYTLGRRFGLPEVARSRQRSGRELVDAYADVMRRARRPEVALQKIVAEVDRELRRKFNIAPDLSTARRNERLPKNLTDTLTQAEIAATTVRNDVSATWAFLELQDALAELKGEPPRRRRRRRS